MDTEKHPVSAQRWKPPRFAKFRSNASTNWRVQLPQLRRQLMRVMSREIRDDQQMMLLRRRNCRRAHRDFPGELVGTFPALAAFSANQFRLSMSRNEIGNYLGLRWKPCPGCSTRFQQNALIAAEGKEIHILDRSSCARWPALARSLISTRGRANRFSRGICVVAALPGQLDDGLRLFDIKSLIRPVIASRTGVIFRDIPRCFSRLRPAPGVDSFAHAM